MLHQTNNLRISDIKHIDSPEQVIADLPISDVAANLVEKTRKQIHDILNNKDDRLLVIIGPCSIHDPRSALEYAHSLEALRNELKDDLLILMRIYFEKPRTRTGWKGLINDPNLDNSFDINKGVRLARKLLSDLNNSGIPAATEFLDIVTGQYISDLVSWGAIGARTTESQIHREMASGLSCPVGFKNGTDGNITIACDAMFAAADSHMFLSPTSKGQIAIFTTQGNPDTHIILRGGKKPNFDTDSIENAKQILKSNHLKQNIMVDLSHANCQKQHRMQLKVGSEIAQQITNGEQAIIGVMIESHLVEGKQAIAPLNELTYGQSITDACIDMNTTKPLLIQLAHSIRSKRQLSKA